MSRKVLVTGSSGLIGGAIAKKLKAAGDHVVGVDLHPHKYWNSEHLHTFIEGDLRVQQTIDEAFSYQYDEVYQMAADMGGAGYIFTGDNDAAVMHNSALINLNVLEGARSTGVPGVFFSSSACVYPEHNQLSVDHLKITEDSAYPAAPDSEYGWEKLFSERLYLSYNRNYGMRNSIGRYHNVFGPYSAWNNGKEKAPAALCRKVAEVAVHGHPRRIKVWGDGQQTRSFLWIDDAVQATIQLHRDEAFRGPVNIGSERMVTINELVHIIAAAAGVEVEIENVPGPRGVVARTSDNTLIEQQLHWKPLIPLEVGMGLLYSWVEGQVWAQQDE